MTAAQGVMFVVGMVLVLAANGLLFAIMQHERREHADAWLNDGQPGAAWFLVPATRPQDWYAHWRVLVRWTFATPTWAREDSSATRLFVAWRGALLAFFAAFVVLFALVAR